jgi:hypothetical protein
LRWICWWIDLDWTVLLFNHLFYQKQDELRAIRSKMLLSFTKAIPSKMLRSFIIIADADEKLGLKCT